MNKSKINNDAYFKYKNCQESLTSEGSLHTHTPYYS